MITIKIITLCIFLYIAFLVGYVCNPFIEEIFDDFDIIFNKVEVTEEIEEENLIKYTKCSNIEVIENTINDKHII